MSNEQANQVPAAPLPPVGLANRLIGKVRAGMQHFHADPVRTLATCSLLGRIHLHRRLMRKPYIYFERHAGIGDIICTFPAVEALRKKYAGCGVVYATRREFIPVVHMNGCANAIIEAGSPSGPPLVLSRDFDAAFEPRLGDERKQTQPRILHMVDEFCQLTGVEAVDRQPRLHVNPGQRRQARQQLQTSGAGDRLKIVMHCGPTWATKQWLPEEWDQLSLSIRQKLGAVVLQVGADVDTARGATRSHRIEGAIDWVGRLSLPETAALIAECDLFVGIDSGLLHVAGAVGTPVVGIFGPTDPRLIMPPVTPGIAVVADVPCAGCHHLERPLHWQSGCPHEIKCMKQISAEQVLDACVKLLEPFRSRHPLMASVLSVV